MKRNVFLRRLINGLGQIYVDEKILPDRYRYSPEKLQSVRAGLELICPEWDEK